MNRLVILQVVILIYQELQTDLAQTHLVPAHRGLLMHFAQTGLQQRFMITHQVVIMVSQWVTIEG